MAAFPRRPRGRRTMARRALTLGTTATLLAMVAGVTPVAGADGGTVDAQVSVQAAAACLQLSTSAISFGTLALGAEDASATPSITVTNCADTNESVMASGTNATGTNAAWTLVDSAGTCADTLGTDNYHLDLLATGAPTPVRLGTSNKDLGTLAAGTGAEQTARISTACPGSTGAGTTMSMQISFLATTVATPPIVLEPITINQASALAAASSQLLGNHDIDVPASCATDPTIACPNGTPSDPLPQVRATGSNIQVTDAGSGNWNVTADASVKTLQPIPVSSLGVACDLNVDTSAAGSPIVSVALTLQFSSYPDPSGETNVIYVHNVTLSGVDTGDISLSGGLTCNLLNTYVGFFIDTLTSQLESYLDGVAVCGTADPNVFETCPPLP